ncbi:MAG: intradiol ring-cleavage dioxygenase [Chloroflexi bacterium]|nr:intradiol ring-cleavage dioxygenase [Chloroflexota bacterium]
MRRFAIAALLLAPLTLSSCAGDDSVPSPTAPPTLASTAAQPQPIPTPVPPATFLPTAVCAPGRLTPAQTEGPYFKTGSPQRITLIEPGLAGTRLIVTGYVVSPDCRPVANARMEFWHADAQGSYDNTGYRLRGHLFTDRDGLYRLETIMPGLYPGRTRHIHVKVLPQTGPGLTTQTYFPNEPSNARDGIFDANLVMALQETNDGRLARYDFVVSVSP